jgi:hypothetical protein
MDCRQRGALELRVIRDWKVNKIGNCAYQASARLETGQKIYARGTPRAPSWTFLSRQVHQAA